jgi:predicted N-acyltransferase
VVVLKVLREMERREIKREREREKKEGVYMTYLFL